MNKKILSFILVLFLIVVPMCGCQKGDDKKASDKKEEKKLTYVFVFPTNTLDPHVDKAYIPVRAGIVETLVKIDEDFTPKPWLLESYDSKDGQNWELKVRNNITFHNGTKLDANIVKANIEDVCKKNKGVNKTLNIESMEAEGQTLKVALKEPNLSFPTEFSNPNTAIVDINESDSDTKPIGTGPFKVEEFKPNASVELVKNDKYWDGEVKLDRVSFQFNEDSNARLQALQSGHADVIFKPASESIEVLKNDSKYKVDSTPGLRTNLVDYNMKQKNMNNPEFRKGLDALINRKEIADKIMEGQATVAYGPFLEDFPFSPEYEKKEFGIEKSLEHFKKSGLTVDGNKVSINGQPLKMKIVTYSQRPELPQVAQLIQSNAEKIGIEMEIDIVKDIDEYLSKNNDWDISVFALLTAPRGDASYFLNAAYLPEGVQNHGHINDPKLTDIINKFNSCTDEEERNKLAKEAITMINKSDYNSFIVHQNVTAAYNERVTGWTTHASEYYMITKDLDVK